MTYSPEGFYSVDGDVFCADCWPIVSTEDDDDGTAIYYDQEADTPTHCARCEALIEHNLTDYGYRYVAEAILEALSGEGGRPAIVKQWAEGYRDDGLTDTLLDLINERVDGWPDVDPWSPCPECFAHGYGPEARKDHAEGCPEAKKEVHGGR